MNYPKGLRAILFRKKRKQIRSINCIVFVIFFLLPFSSFASHIVGGEMSYRCLNSDLNEFEISLTVYRDCFFGASNAPFDPLATIGIFNGNQLVNLPGTIDGIIQIPETVDDTLDIVLSDPCLFPPDDVCVHTMTYKDTIILPPLPGGYQLVYQRCCRNASISNIISSFDTGASFVIDISETAIEECNSSPDLVTMPPIFLCVNEPFESDQSLTDIDGDSLVYKLCTPFDGGTFNDPVPIPPSPPPYEEINWFSPPYGLNNLLNGAPGGVPLQLDPVTGILTGVPNTNGIFLVGMCIEEYRNGVLISETRREFQYNVGECTDLLADFEAPILQCDDLEVTFENTSLNADNFEWHFNDAGNPNATSTLENPTFTFSDFGVYNVMLISTISGACIDTTFGEVTLLESSVQADFDYVTLNCQDSVIVALIDSSVDSIHTIESWDWVLSDGQTSSEQFPLFVIDSTQTLFVNLTVKSSNGCESIAQDFAPINLIPSTLLEDEIVICDGDIIQLNPNAPIGLPFVYQWSPAIGLSDDDVASPTVTTSSDIEYTLMIVDTLNDCSAELSTKITVLDSPILTIDVSNSCDDEIELTAISNITQGDYLWSTDPGFNNVISDSSTILISGFGLDTYYVQFSTPGACMVRDSIVVEEQSIDVSLINTSLVCIGDVATFTGVNGNPDDDVTYTWFDNTGQVLSTDSIYEFVATQAGNELFYFQAENQFGCTFLDSLFLSTIDPDEPVDAIYSQACNSNVINFSNLGANAFYYFWVIELPTGNDTLPGINFQYTFPNTGTYNVSLEPINGLPCTLPEGSIEVVVNESLVAAGFDWDYIDCQNDLEIQFSDISTTAQGNITQWFWTFGNAPTVTTQNTTLELGGALTVPIELIVFTNEGCSDTITDVIEFSLIDIGTFEEEAIICTDGGSVVLNPFGDQSLDYIWSPTPFLSNSVSTSPIANPPVTTTYNVTITDPNNPNCEVVQSVLVTVPDQQVMASYDYNIIDCDNDLVTFSFVDSSTPTGDIDNWFWSFRYLNLPDPPVTVNAPNVTFVALTGSNLIVEFQVQTVEGCTDILVDTILVDDFSFDLPQDEIIKCTGLPVNLNSGGNPDFDYDWSHGSTDTDPIVNPTATTEYCVTVTNGGCSQEDCVTVVVPDIPLMADFTFSLSDCVDEAVISFQDESQYSFANITGWDWTFSNGQTSTQQNPSITVNQSTTIQATLVVVTADGCQASFTQSVEVNLLTIDIPSLVVLCEGSPVQLNPNGNPNHDYSWSPSSGLTDDDVPSPFAFPTSTTTYTVVISDGACEVVQLVEVVVPDVPLDPSFSFTIDDCTDIAVIDFMEDSPFSPGSVTEWNWQFSNGDSSDIANPSIILDQSQTLEVTLEIITNNGCVGLVVQSIDVSLIDINISDTIVNCTGAGVELNPGGNITYDYNWSPSTGLNNNNSPNPTANPTSTTTYSVTVSDGPCELIREVVVVVPDAPLTAGFTYTFDDCTDNAIIQFTDTTTFSNNTITSWNWTFAGNNTTTSDIANPVIILNQSDTLQVDLEVTTADGCIAIISEEVEVNLIDINIPNSIIFCNSSGTVLNPNGNPIYDYSWSPAIGLSDTDVPSPVVTGLTQTTVYTVTVNFGNCTLTRNVEIILPDVPLQANFDLEYLTCIDSASLQFNDSSLYSGTIVAWDWEINGQTSDVQNPIFTFFQNQPIDAQLIVTSSHGCMDTLNSGFDISIMNDVLLPTDTASCNSNGVFLNPNSNPTYDYSWSPIIGLSDPNIANPFASPDSSQNYTVTITNLGTGCVEERTVAYNVPTIPLTAGFDWDLVTCVDSAVLAFTDTSFYSGTISEWDWNIDNEISDTTQHPSFVFQNLDTVNIQLTVTSIDGCIDSIETDVAIEIIDIGLMEDTIILCNEDSVFLNPNGNPNLFYTWNPPASLDSINVANPLATPLTTTEYSVTITSPNNIGCNDVRTVEVFVPTNPLDLIWNYPSDTIICEPVIELLAQSNNANEFIWSNEPDFQNVIGNDPNLTAPAGVGTTFYLQVVDSVGCSLTDSIEVSNYGILASLDAQVSLCFGDSVELLVDVNPLSQPFDLEYTWSPSDGITMNDNTSTPLLMPDDTTEYTLLIENSFGCEYHDTIDVNVLNLGDLIELNIDRDSINAGDEIQLNATEFPGWNYNWEPCEDLSNCSIFDPTANPEVTTTYSLVIEDIELGCTYEDSITVFVFDQNRCQEPFVFVPKAFTPNDDGLNDFLYVRGNYIEEVEFVIFNRWGEKVFETQDISEGWDGKVDGKTVSPDVFGYYVSIRCFGGEEYLMKGNVTLIR